MPDKCRITGPYASRHSYINKRRKDMKTGFTNGVKSERLFTLLISIIIIYIVFLFYKSKDITADEKIHEFVQPLTDDLNTNSENYKGLARQLQNPDKKTARLIMNEVKMIGRNERIGNFEFAMSRTMLLRKVYGIAGTNMLPLLPDLGAEYLSGDSVGASAWGLVAIGGPAWAYLQAGLTNSNSKVQISSVEAMAYADNKIASDSLPLFNGFLESKSEILRIATVETISQLPIDEEKKENILLAAIEKDASINVRCMAIKSLAKIGKITDRAHLALIRASEERDKSVKYSAVTALHEIDGSAVKLRQ